MSRRTLHLERRFGKKNAHGWYLKSFPIGNDIVS